MTRRSTLLVAAVLVGCGGTIPTASDGGADASADGSSKDASKDAPIAVDAADADTCPTLLPQRLQPCPKLDQLCLYGCGIARRCTSKGWDDDLTVDAGPPCP